jgi:hypothetical protein
MNSDENLHLFCHCRSFDHPLRWDQSMTTATNPPNDDAAAAALLDYVEGTMSAGDRAAFEARLSGDATLREEVALLFSMHAHVRADSHSRLSDDAPPAHLVDAMVRAEVVSRSDVVRQAVAKSMAPKSLWWQRLAMVAVPGGALAMGAMAVVVMQRQPEPSMTAIAADSVLVAPAAPPPSPAEAMPTAATPEPAPDQVGRGGGVLGSVSAATRCGPGSAARCAQADDEVVESKKAKAPAKTSAPAEASAGDVSSEEAPKREEAGKAAADKADRAGPRIDAPAPAAVASGAPPPPMSPAGDLRRQRNDLALQGYVATAFRELEQGRVRDALDLFDQAHMMDARNPYVAAGTARCWMSLKNPSKAVAQAPILLNVAPALLKDELIAGGIKACASAAEQTGAKPLALQLWRKLATEPAYKASAQSAVDRLK